MDQLGIKVSGCFGDVLNSTPVIKYLSKSHNKKISVETDVVRAFQNNPYIDKIYDTTKNEFLPQGIPFYECNVHNFGEVQKQIRKMSLIDYWSTQIGCILTPDERTLEFYPNEEKMKLPEDKYVVINPSITWESRTWSKENWELLSERILSLGIKVVTIGKDIVYDEDDKKSFYVIDNPNVIDMTNKLDLSDTWHLINKSFAIITMDNGLLHLAGTTNTNIIELGSAIHPYYRSPYRHGTQDYKHKFVGGSCKLFCQSEMKYNVLSEGKLTAWNMYLHPGCYEHKPKYECHPSVNGAFNALLELMMNK
jgi:ADP-heptose:LPS heptosyltransferase